MIQRTRIDRKWIRENNEELEEEHLFRVLFFYAIIV